MKTGLKIVLIHMLLVFAVKAKAQCPDTLVICHNGINVVSLDLDPSNYYVLELYNFPGSAIRELDLESQGDGWFEFQNVNYWFTDGTYQILNSQTGEVMCKGFYNSESCVDHIWFRNHFHCQDDEIVDCENTAGIDNYTYINHRFCLGDTSNLYIYTSSTYGADYHQAFSPDRLRSDLGEILEFSDKDFRIVWDQIGEECMELKTTSIYGIEHYSYRAIKVYPSDPILLEDIWSNSTGVEICVGESVELNVTSNLEVDPKWTVSDGRTYYGFNNTIQFNEAGVYTIEVSNEVSDNCNCAKDGTFEVLVKEGDKPQILCKRTVCIGETSTYFSETECEEYHWEIGPGGTILSGGSTGDSYVEVQWDQGEENEISLFTPDCFENTCVEKVTEIINVIDTDSEISGEILVCDGDVTGYRIPNFTGTSFEWTIDSYGTILNGQGSNSIQVAWDSNGSAASSVITVSYNNCNLECVGTASLNVDIRPKLNLEINNSRQCMNTDFQIYNDLNELLDWTLIKPDGTADTFYSESYLELNFSEPGSYFLEGTEVGSTSCNGSNYLIFEIEEEIPPVATIDGPALICKGKQLRYTVPGLKTGQTILWKIKDGSTPEFTLGPQRDLIYAWNSDGPYIVSVLIVDQFTGCESQIAEFVLSENSEILGDKQICVGETMTYRVPDSDGEMILWQIDPANAAEVVNANQDYLIVKWLRAGSFQLQAEICNKTINEIIDVSEYPVMDIDYESLVCLDDSSSYSITTNSSNELAIRSGNIVLTNDRQGFLFPGKYSIELLNPAGCRIIEEIMITEIDRVEFDIYASARTFCPEEENSILSIVDPIPGFSYEWFYNGMSTGVISDEYVSNEVGLFHVIATDPNGCPMPPVYISLGECCQGDTGEPFDPVLVDIEATAVDCSNYDFEVLPIFASSNFVWNFDDQWSSSNYASGISVSHSFSRAGYYTVRANGDALCDTVLVDYCGVPVETEICEMGSIVVRVPVVADFEFTPECVNEASSFRESSSKLPGLTGLEYEWDFGDPSSATNFSDLRHPQHVYTDPGVYEVSLRIKDVSGCYSSISKSIEIDGIAAYGLVGDTLLCLGTPANFTMATDCPACETSWNFNDPASGINNISDSSSPVHIFTKEGDYSVEVEIISGNGCVTTESHNIIIVNNDLQGEISSSSSNLKCPNESITLDAPPGGYSYLWNTGENSASIEVMNEGAYDVTLTNEAGCSYSPQSYTVFNHYNSDVRIYSYHPNTNEILYDSMTVCRGDYYNIWVTQVPNGVYDWHPVSETSFRLNYSQHLSNLSAGEYFYSVDVFDQVNGCSFSSDSFKLLILDPIEKPVIQADALYLCENDRIELSVENYDSSLHYEWSNGASGERTEVYSAGAYRVSAYNDNDCVAYSDLINVYRNPSINGWMTGCLEVCFPRELCIGLIQDNSYELVLNDSVIGSVSSSTDFIELHEPGSYQLVATNPNGCSIISDRLELTAMSEEHSLSGIVFKDDNDNDVYDTGDRLLVDVTMYLMSGNTVVSETQTDSMGFYMFEDIGLSNIQVVLDTASVHFLFDDEIEYPLIYFECIEHKRIDFSLYSTCDFPVGRETYYTCPGEPLMIYGKEYHENQRDSLIFNLFEDCDSTLIIDVLPYQEPDLSFEYANSCSEYNNGTIMVHKLTTDSLSFELEGSAVSQDTLFTDLAPGDYMLYVYTEHNCQFEYPFTIEEIQSPEILVSTENTCLGESEASIRIEVLSNGDLEFRLDQDSSYTSMGEFTDLESGDYEIYYRDSLGCEYSESVEIIDFEEAGISYSTSRSCEEYDDGAIVIEVTAGDPLVSLGDQTNYTDELVRENLASGSYTLYYKSEFGCIDSLEFEIDEVERPELELYVKAECEDNALGSLMLSSNTADIEYSLDGVNFYQESEFEGLSASNYTLYYRTKEGCEYMEEFELLEFAQPDIEINTSHSCEGTNSGTVELIFLSGEIFDVSFDGDSYSDVLFQEALSPGTYILYLRNELDCIYEYEYIIKELPKPELNALSFSSCPNDDTGYIEIVSFEIDHEISINGSAFSSDSIFYGLSEGMYTIDVRDSNMCMNSSVIEITSLLPLIANMDSFALNCYQEAVLISPQIESHFGEIEYQWQDGSDVESLLAEGSGIYKVTVSDACDTKVFSVDMNIQIFDEEESFYLPNVFTMKTSAPNNCFRVFPDPELELLQYEFYIFDRWGEAMFIADDPEACWDGIFNGDYVEQGVYVYLMRAVVMHCDEIKTVKKVGDVTALD